MHQIRFVGLCWHLMRGHISIEGSLAPGEFVATEQHDPLRLDGRLLQLNRCSLRVALTSTLPFSHSFYQSYCCGVWWRKISMCVKNNWYVHVEIVPKKPKGKRTQEIGRPRSITDHHSRRVLPSSGIERLPPLLTSCQGAKTCENSSETHVFANRNKDIRSQTWTEHTWTSPLPSFSSIFLAISISGQASLDRSEFSFQSHTRWGCRAFCQAKHHLWVNYNSTQQGNVPLGLVLSLLLWWNFLDLTLCNNYAQWFELDQSEWAHHLIPD